MVFCDDACCLWLGRLRDAIKVQTQAAATVLSSTAARHAAYCAVSAAQMQVDYL